MSHSLPFSLLHSGHRAFSLGCGVLLLLEASPSCQGNFWTKELLAWRLPWCNSACGFSLPSGQNVRSYHMWSSFFWPQCDFSIIFSTHMIVLLYSIACGSPEVSHIPFVVTSVLWHMQFPLPLHPWMDLRSDQSFNTQFTSFLLQEASLDLLLHCLWSLYWSRLLSVHTYFASSSQRRFSFVL